MRVSVCPDDAVQLGRSAEHVESIHSGGIGYSGYGKTVLSGTVDAEGFRYEVLLPYILFL